MTSAEEIARLIDAELTRAVRKSVEELAPDVKRDWMIRYYALEELADKIADVWVRYDFPECIGILDLRRSPRNRLAVDPITSHDDTGPLPAARAEAGR